MTKEEFGRGD